MIQIRLDSIVRDDLKRFVGVTPIAWWKNRKAKLITVYYGFMFQEQSLFLWVNRINDAWLRFYPNFIVRVIEGWRMVLVKSPSPSRGASLPKENARKDKGRSRVSRGNSPSDQAASRGNSPGKSNPSVKVVTKSSLLQSRGNEWVLLLHFYKLFVTLHVIKPFPINYISRVTI